jgi:hypothetical protein
MPRSRFSPSLALRVLCDDVAEFYRLVSFPVRDFETFEQLWCDRKMEHLFYAGMKLPHHCAAEVVSDLLFAVAGAYLAIPSTIAVNALEFGILLSYFFLHLQPEQHSVSRPSGQPRTIPLTFETFQHVQFVIASDRDGTIVSHVVQRLWLNLIDEHHVTVAHACPLEGAAVRALIKAHRLNETEFCSDHAAAAVDSMARSIDNDIEAAFEHYCTDSRSLKA